MLKRFLSNITDGAFLNLSSELPDTIFQNRSRDGQKVKKRKFFSGKITFGNSEVAFLAWV